MNKEILAAYELKADIHTFSIKTLDEIKAIDESVEQCINSVTKGLNGVTSITINPNKLRGDIFTFSEFCSVVNEIFEKLGVKNYRFTRVDFRFDSYDPQHYRTFAKLNRYLLSAFSVMYTVENSYRTKNMFSQKLLSMAIKNSRFELENYNRAEKSKITGNKNEMAQARLEERTVAKAFGELYKDTILDNFSLLKYEFNVNWVRRWLSVPDYLGCVQDKYNDELEAFYKEESQLPHPEFRNVTEFVMIYQSCFFTRKQLIQFLQRMNNVKNAEERAKSYKRTYDIEFFSQKDILTAIREIKRATEDFFEC